MLTLDVLRQLNLNGIYLFVLAFFLDERGDGGVSQSRPLSTQAQ